MLIIWQQRFIQKAFLYLSFGQSSLLYEIFHRKAQCQKKRFTLRWLYLLWCLHQVCLLCWDVWNQQADSPVGPTNWFNVWTSYQQAVILLLVLQKRLFCIISLVVEALGFIWGFFHRFLDSIFSFVIRCLWDFIFKCCTHCHVVVETFSLCIFLNNFDILLLNCP